MAATHPLVAVSNYPEWIDELIRRFRLDRFFREYRISCRMGARKPDPAFFRALLDSCALEPGELLLVDDRSENVDGAAALGIPGIVFEDAARLKEALQRRGLS